SLWQRAGLPCGAPLPTRERRTDSPQPGPAEEPLVAAGSSKDESPRDRPGLIATLFGLRAFGRPASSARRAAAPGGAAGPPVDAASIFKFRAGNAARSVLAPPPLVSV